MEELRARHASGSSSFVESIEQPEGRRRADRCRSRPSASSTRSTRDRRRRARPGPTPTRSHRLRHRRAEARPARRRRRAARHDTDAGRRGRAALRRAPRAARPARRPAPATPAARCRSHGGVVHLARADEPHPRDRRRRTCVAVVEPNVDHRRSAGRGRARRAVLSARSGIAAAVGRSAATSPSAPAARARSSTARPSGTCSASRPCCRPARSSRPAARSVKNVVGYDLTQLLVGSEGTLAIITRDHPAPGAEAAGAGDAARDVRAIVERRGAAVTNIDPRARRAGGARADRRRFARSGRARTSNVRSLAPEGTGGAAAARSGRHRRGGRRGSARWSSRRAATPARPRSCARATTPSAQELWRVRRELSLVAARRSRRSSSTTTSSCRRAASRSCSRWSSGIKTRLPACASRASATPATATSTSTSWSTPATRTRCARAHEAERVLFEGVVALEGSISGEHGIGFAKAPYLPLELSADEIALMKRVKRAFDPDGHPEPGQDFPS